MKQLLIFAIAAALGWVGFQYASAVYESVEIRDAVTDVILAHRYDKTDAVIIDEIFTMVSSKQSVKVKYRDIDVTRTENETAVKFTYTKTIEVPLIKKQWVLQFSPSVKQTLGF